MIERPRRALGLIRWARVATLLVAVLVTASPHALAAKKPGGRITAVAAADSLATTPQSPARLGVFTEWTRGATLDDLVYVLRRSPDQLGDLEHVALEAALQRTPVGRASLRDRLEARLAAERARGKQRDAWAAMGPGVSSISSAWRVGLLLPADGDFAGDADAVALGFEAGLEAVRVPGRPQVECVRYSTRGESAADVATAFDSAAAGTGLVCGGYTPSSMITLAAGSRWRGLPVVVPGWAEPAAARLSPRIWGLGPSGAQRGRALAIAVAPGASDRVALLVSNGADTAFARGFAAACRQRGAAIIGRMVYSPGNASFSAEIRTLIGQRATVLFWDGDPIEAAALLRQLTRERVSLRVCGGDGFDPSRHHRETRVFLEGVTFVPSDWTLAPADQARLDARIQSVTKGPADETHTRGFLAGRIVGAAIAGGAITPEELAVALALQSAAAGGEPGVLDVRAQGGELPVYSIAAGKAERAR